MSMIVLIFLCSSSDCLETIQTKCDHGLKSVTEAGHYLELRSVPKIKRLQPRPGFGSFP